MEHVAPGFLGLRRGRHVQAPGGDGGRRRQPQPGCAQRRHRGPAPAARAAADAGPGAARDPGPRSLPRRRIGPPGRRRARGLRLERGGRGAPPPRARSGWCAVPSSAPRGHGCCAEPGRADCRFPAPPPQDCSPPSHSRWRPSAMRASRRRASRLRGRIGTCRTGIGTSRPGPRRGVLGDRHGAALRAVGHDLDLDPRLPERPAAGGEDEVVRLLGLLGHGGVGDHRRPRADAVVQPRARPAATRRRRRAPGRPRRPRWRTATRRRAPPTPPRRERRPDARPAGGEGRGRSGLSLITGYSSSVDRSGSVPGVASTSREVGAAPRRRCRPSRGFRASRRARRSAAPAWRSRRRPQGEAGTRRRRWGWQGRPGSCGGVCRSTFITRAATSSALRTGGGGDPWRPRMVAACR